MTTVKKRVYKVIQPHKHNDIFSTIFDWLIVSLIAINVFVIIIDTLDLPPQMSHTLRIIEGCIVVVFTIEYILRLWTANIIYRNLSPLKASLKYAFTFLMLVDFIAIMPFYLQFVLPVDIDMLRILRLFRIIWFFKINRVYVKALSDIFEVFKKKSMLLLFSLSIIFTFMIVASVWMYHAEKQAQPEVFSNALSGLWWAIITITTVGYGEIYPITFLGRAIAALFSILSIGMVAIPTGIISSGFIEKAREERKAKSAKEHKRFCPYCGKNLKE